MILSTDGAGAVIMLIFETSTKIDALKLLRYTNAFY